MEFVKVHGTGNDFVLLPDLEDRITLTAGLARALCDRRLGVGADGVIRLGAARAGTDGFMDYRNADGSVAEMCGNGVRCVAKYLADRDLVAGEVVRVGSRAGVKPVEVVGRDPDGRVALVRVDMGAPRPHGSRVLAVGRERVEVTTLSMGNPHAVIPVPDVAGAPVRAWGPVVERDPAFPDGTNVEFVAVTAPDRVEGRIWERGVGETPASGTGVSAMAAAAHLWGLAKRHVVVAVPGGELDVEWADETLYVTGPAVEVASGRLDEAWLAAVGEGS